MDSNHKSGVPLRRILIGIWILSIGLISSSSFAARIGRYETIEVAFDAPDTSVELVGFLSIPPAYKLLTGPPALVILLHQQNESSESWKTFREELLQTGFAVFAMDLRGHGLSTFDLKSQRVRAKNTFILGEQLKYPNDIAFLVDKLVEVHGSKFDTTRFAVVGADIGGSAGLVFAQSDQRVKFICLISPGMEYQGLRIMPVLREFDKRPILLMSSDKDVYSMGSIDLITDLLPHRLEVFIVESMFHGNRLVNTSIPLRSRILQDLTKHMAVDANQTK